MKDADAVRNLAQIVSQHKDEDILLVVSAMGKTTNALEQALADFREHDGQLGMEALHDVIAYHDGIINELFGDDANPAFGENIAGLFIELWEKLQKTDTPYDYQYDQTVCYGELISTSIIHEYLSKCDIPTRWLDARKYVIAEDELPRRQPRLGRDAFENQQVERRAYSRYRMLDPGFHRRHRRWQTQRHPRA